MKHLPNILTLANLFCGCIAIAFILNSQPFVNEINGEQYWVSGTSQAYYGSLFIFIAAIFDLFDGMVARWLGVHSPIGKDLDSLADVVSFGVAPSMILFKMIWAAYMAKPHAIDVSMIAVAPAFLLACFGALRLARFNNAPSTTSQFTGVPIPAIGLVVASFPLINLYNPLGIGMMMQNEWILYGIIAVLCWLMVSKLRLFTLKFHAFSVKKYWAQLAWILLTLVSLPFLKSLSIPFSFLLYIILSIAYKPSQQ
ncbi:MAG: CDP-alcohol phosphatidyltransferase family protein [Bacteroidetes bacterium]|jgi:CDP-diacylglycerol--serine O-phosphatidyltransferase|nr:CDP-alcohol phosphatidyltransferase family protein [Bacteroidota bacterium]HMT36308.1 CDP-alcohol phosphatidyltransferase family protein [Chitinophagaceae bacterium]MBK7041474.1 CDP-alcohol phosphatidyltransferase family protein [Bacteroidota bacterium]MBK7588006.1 CDP-alcohol phosphatidyltransferase family protein [Bacteroidota bacterium]MBK8330672.1 CDP-alcohol phosphatidyltransferase family protein [Bacteroidota bacterium]